MKCISVAQPLAWAILAGLESVEYRCYPTDYRGDLLIYASADDDRWQREHLARYSPIAPPWEELPRGLIVGLVELWACEQVRRASGPGACGTAGLSNPLRRLPARGCSTYPFGMCTC
jgi:hypothetical protein